MKKIIDYKIVTKESSYDAEKEINKLIQEGYQPFGLFYVKSDYTNTGLQFGYNVQAMVKCEK